MKRRDFIQSTTAESKAPPLDAEVTRVRVGNWRTADLREANRLAREAGTPLRHPDPPDDDSNYWAEAIRIADSYFYRVGNIVVPVLEYEYRNVIDNPSMYYFSSALKLHYRIQRKRDGVPEPV